MRRIIRPFAVLFSVMLLMASCLESDDYSDYVYYSDTAITSFSLSTINRYMVTKSTTEKDEDGNPADSIYVENVDESAYDFYIDQQKKKIYNPDSLPTGCDTTHVVCAINSKNGGVIVLGYENAEGEDSLAVYSSNDSIDFSKLKDLRVYANDGMSYRSYEVSLNVHKEEGDTVNWQYMGKNSAFINMSGMRVVVVKKYKDKDKKESKDSLFVFGATGSNTSVWAMPVDGTDWLEKQPLGDNNAYKSIIVKDGCLYTLSNGKVVCSAYGTKWNNIISATDINQSATDINQIVAAGRDSLYATTEDDKIMWWWHGHEWTADAMSNDVILPSENISYAILPLATNADAERIVMIGNPEESKNDSVATVLGKIEEYSENPRNHSWTMYSEDNGYRLPRLSNLCVVVYDGKLLALGGRGLGQSKAKAFSTFYISEDNGITWHATDKIYLPADFNNGDKDVFAMTVDDDNYIWVVCGGTGEVWRGRLNRLGWKEEQTSFTE